MADGFWPHIHHKITKSLMIIKSFITTPVYYIQVIHVDLSCVFGSEGYAVNEGSLVPTCHSVEDWTVMHNQHL